MTAPTHPYRLTALVVVVVAGLSRPAAAAEKVESRFPEVPHVRSENPSIAAAIHDATERSATFRGLIETIQATDGLVYVTEGRCGNSVRNCLSLSVKVAGPFRLLRVLVDARAPTCDLMASIGHELQHVTEVLREPHITSMKQMYSFFGQEGPTGSDRFETPAAIHIGLRVGSEVCHRGKLR